MGHYEPGKMPDMTEEMAAGTFDKYVEGDDKEEPWMSPVYKETRWKTNVLYPQLCAMGLQQHLLDLHAKGYAVIPPELFMPADYQEKLKAALLKVSERRSGGIRPDEETGSSHGGMNAPLGQFMRFITFEDPIFEPILTNPVVLGLVSYVLGPDAILSLNDGMVKGPGKNSTSLHNDNGRKTEPHYGANNGFGDGLTMNLTLSDYGAEKGGLGFVPGSHLWAREPTQGEYRHMQRKGQLVPVNAKAGSLVVWGSNTWHVSFPRTDPGLRLTTLMFWVTSKLQTQSDFRAAVKYEHPDVLERNPKAFQRIMDVHGVFPFREEDFDPTKGRNLALTQKHDILKDALPIWQDFFRGAIEATGGPRP